MNRSVSIVIVIAAVTAMTRFLPFLLFPSGKKAPAFLQQITDRLPMAVMGMLVVYCLKDVSPWSSSHGIPEFIAVVIVVLSYVYKRNVILSIVLGTLIYMFLVQGAFL